MDRLSAALIAGIIVLSGISGMIVYHTWIKDRPQLQTVAAAAEDGGNGGELVFHKDTSMVNSGDGRLWVRAKILYDNRYEEDKYQVVSAAIEAGCWDWNEDGWYYLQKPLDSGQRALPLIDVLLYDGREALPGETGRFRLQVEAVDAAWLQTEPVDGYQAWENWKDGF